MASRKTTAAPIQPSDIKLGGKSKKDAALLARFVQQEGRAALSLLDDVLDKGGLVMKRAAIAQLGQLDPRRAETFVRDGLKASGSKKKGKGAVDRDELVTWLALIGSPSTLRFFLDEGGRVDDLDLPRAAIEALYEVVAAEVPELEIEAVRGRLEQVNLLAHGEVQTYSLQPGEPARTLARALLRHGDETARSWGATVLGTVDGVEALDEIRRLGVTPGFSLIGKLCEGASVEAQLRELTPFLKTREGRTEVLSLLRGRLDPRWFPVLEPYIDHPGVTEVLAFSGHPAALTRMREQADGPAFDRITQRACHALGQAADPLATPILLRWLADPIGRQSSPMLLTALGECAGPDAIREIERLSKFEPQRASFYGHAIASIRQRAV